MPVQAAQSWFPDYIFHRGRFHAGLALCADEHGRIVKLSSDPQDMKIARRLPNRAILPGLVNAHSHTFQRVIRGRTEFRTSADGDNFWTWREAMYHAAGLLSPEDIYDVARMAFLEMLLTGICNVGEFHYLHHQPDGRQYDDPNLLAMQVVRAALDTGLRIALLKTAYVRSGWRRDPNPQQDRFITPLVHEFIDHSEHLFQSLKKTVAEDAAWMGIAPHSVRAVPVSYLQEVTNYARLRQLKVHMHVAEQPAEVEACVAEYQCRPVDFLFRQGVLDRNFTAIHATHVTQNEIEALGKAESQICACGTTERNLGDGVAQADDWAAQNVPFCYGTDSNVQINLMEDARQLEYHLRLQRLERAVLAPNTQQESLAQRLFDGATSSGAKSLGGPGGSLEAGRPADFYTIDLNDPSLAGAGQESLLTHVVFSGERTAIDEVYVAGLPVIQEGRHKDQIAITAQFLRVQRKLWQSAT